MLEIRDVVKRYQGKTAVNHMTLTMEEGQLIALLGPNGSGKTTLMKMIAGLVKPTSGEILLEGNPVGAKEKRRIAYMPTEAYFYNYMTALDAGKYYRDFFDDFHFDRFLHMLEAERLNCREKIRNMSSGMTAKLKLALIFSRDSRVSMLDEPLNGIDIIARERTLHLIAENHTSDRVLIVSSHLVDELESMIDYAVFMREGEVVLSGSVPALREEHGASIVEIYRSIYGESGGKADA